VNIGVYFDLRNRPDRRREAARLYGFTLELCEEAERLGAHSVWLSEHHQFDDDYLPQPLTFAAAVAARTRRVRIGTALVLAPIRPAAQLAEEAAVVDLISGGRLDLGIGAGYRRSEYELAGADFAARFKTLDGRYGELRALWEEGGVTPRPVQRPIPVWMGYMGPRGARRAGRLGAPLLSPDPRLIEPYTEGLREGGHAPEAGRRSGPISAFVSDDPERDWPLVAEHLAYQQDSYNAHALLGTGQPAARPTDPERMRAKGLGDMGRSFLIATPEETAEAIRHRFGGTGVETLFLFASIGAMDDDVTARHVEAICRMATLVREI
jgi:alkanesulfonate monooxygenase SsuD/methylene tetrahydromethanopterin reductase-like flavin-dependent oxidoreductase (luciferase family)